MQVDKLKEMRAGKRVRSPERVDEQLHLAQEDTSREPLDPNTTRKTIVDRIKEAIKIA